MVEESVWRILRGMFGGLKLYSVCTERV